MGLYCDGCGLPGGSRQGLNSPRWRRLGGVSKGDAVRGDMAARARRGIPCAHAIPVEPSQHDPAQRAWHGGVRGIPKYAEKTHVQPSHTRVRVQRSRPGTPQTPQAGEPWDGRGERSGFPQSIAPRCNRRGWRLRWRCGLLRTGRLLLELQRSPRASGGASLGAERQQTANSPPEQRDGSGEPPQRPNPSAGDVAAAPRTPAPLP